MSCPKRRKLSGRRSSQPSLIAVALDNVRKESDSRNWSTLPPELLVKVFVYLASPKDRMAVGSVCSHWRLALNVPTLWNNSWIFPRPGLKSRPQAFWDLLHQRDCKNFTLVQYKDLHALSQQMCGCTNGLKLIVTEKLWIGIHNSNPLDIVRMFSSLRVLHLQFSGYGCFPFRWLKEMNVASLASSLVELKLSEVNDLSMQDFGCLSHCNVRVLTITFCGSLTSIDTMQLICQFPSLKRLNICNCLYYNEIVSSKSSVDWALPSTITHLNLSRTTFYLAGSFFRHIFRNLRYINLMFCMKEPEVLVSTLSSLPSLAEIYLRGNHCNDYVLSSLTSKQLKKIDLAVNQDISMVGMRCLSSIAKDTLTSLAIGNCATLMMQVDMFINNLHKLFPSLEYLDISGWMLRGFQLCDLVLNNKHLKELTVLKPNDPPEMTIDQLNVTRTIIHYVV